MKDKTTESIRRWEGLKFAIAGVLVIFALVLSITIPIAGLILLHHFLK